MIQVKVCSSPDTQMTSKYEIGYFKSPFLLDPMSRQTDKSSLNGKKGRNFSRA